MPQVASDPKVHASNFHMPRVARPAPSDRAPSPFESLVEETSQSAEPVPPRQESKVAKSDEKEAPAKSKDCKAAEPNEDAKPGNSDDTAADETPFDGTSTNVDGKKIAQTEAAGDLGDSIRPKADIGPPAGQQKDDTNAAPPTDGVVTVTSSSTISIVPTSVQTANVTPDDGKQPEQPPQQLAVVADAIPNKIKLPDGDLPKTISGKKAEDSKGKQGDGVDQVETDQPSTETDGAFQILTKDDAPQRAEGKSQSKSGDGDKEHALQARSDAIASNHSPGASGSTPAGTDLAGTTKVSADTTTQLPISSTTTHSTANAAGSAAPSLQQTPQTEAVPLSGVAIEIAGKAIAGKNRFEIRLDPPELGRIEVRLDVGRDGSISSHVIADRKDTLDLLQRDGASLQRAFEDAGLKTSDQSLQFSLRDHSAGREQSAPAADTAQLIVEDEIALDPLPIYNRLASARGGLDIRV